MSSNRGGADKFLDDSPVYICMFKSRNKDNAHIDGFVERQTSFLTRDPVDSKYIRSRFQQFVQDGLPGETSRLYYSINSRDSSKIKDELIILLVSCKNFNLCAMDRKLANIAANKCCAVTKYWMFDFDIDDESKVREFTSDITYLDPTLEVVTHRTPHGYAVVVDHKFDTRQLFVKWSTDDITLKRDAMLCVDWKTKLLDKEN